MNGFFFRQYPLVYEGEVIENKLKNLSQRKALAILNDEVVVVLSHDRLSFSEFSHALVDLGVKNAIYLTGSTGYLKAKLGNDYMSSGNAYQITTPTQIISSGNNPGLVICTISTRLGIFERVCSALTGTRFRTFKGYFHTTLAKTFFQYPIMSELRSCKLCRWYKIKPR